MGNNSLISIQVINDCSSQTIYCNPGDNLLKVLIENNVYMSAVCGGRGRCGKCKVRIIEGKFEITTLDQKLLSKNEINRGFRLACNAHAIDHCRIEIPFIEAETSFDIISTGSNWRIGKNSSKEEKYFIIAIDIGTTTIAMKLVGVPSYRIVKTHTRINRQRIYGADVISRINASNEGKGKLLKESIIKDLLEGILELMHKHSISKDRIKALSIAANTTMIHLLMGYSCETLGTYPFTPVNINLIEKSFKEIFSSDYLDIPVTILPGISTYVGADITAGLLTCRFDKTEKTSMFIDIGTNGEMAIGNKDKIFVCSTAAGPAFEGGNISCGIGSVPGAISSISINKDNSTTYKTINNRQPTGICGTGVIEITAELMKARLIDETGLLDERYSEQGFKIITDKEGKDILFTQKDIREVQLAKSAIRAGIEILKKRFGVDYNEIDKVYIAGGFGLKIDIQKSIYIGLLPKQFDEKIEAVGNSSLSGAIEYLLDPNAKDRTEKLIKISKEIQLSSDKDFNEYYIDNMFFKKIY